MKMIITEEDLRNIVGKWIYEVRESESSPTYLRIYDENKEKQDFLLEKRVSQVLYSPRQIRKESSETCLTMYDYFGNPIHTKTLTEFVEWFNKNNYRVLFHRELDLLFKKIKELHYE